MPNAKKYLTPEILTELSLTAEVDELNRAVEYLAVHPFGRPPAGKFDWAAAKLALAADFSQRSVAFLEEVFAAHPESLASGEDFRRSLRQLRKELLELKVLKLDLAVFPSPEGLQRLARGAKDVFGRETVLKIEVDPRLLGGAVISVGGRYFDFSLRARLRQLWPTLKEELAKELAPAT